MMHPFSLGMFVLLFALWLDLRTLVDCLFGLGLNRFFSPGLWRVPIALIIQINRCIRPGIGELVAIEINVFQLVTIWFNQLFQIPEVMIIPHIDDHSVLVHPSGPANPVNIGFRIRWQIKIHNHW